MKYHSITTEIESLNLPEGELALVKELASIKSALDEAAIVAITDVQGRITYVNETFCEISRYTPDELLGQDHRILNSGYHPKAFFKSLWTTISKGRIWKGEIRNRAKDGSYYWVDTTIVPFVDDATGKPYQYVAIRKDITYLKQVEGELRLLNEELEKRVDQRTAELQRTLDQLRESERMRETFVSALTHDLRTPLVAERRALELLQAQQYNLPEKLVPLAERLIRNNDDLLELVNKLLETYHFESGKIRLLLQPVNLEDLVADCVEKLAPLVYVKNISINSKFNQNIPVIEADPEQLRRVCTNLLGNAIENIQPDGRISVTASSLGSFTEICFEDNGPGIPSEVLPHLFDRYFVTGQARKKIGSGLGLSICQMIVKLHGGSIRVESKLGQGTRFFITLPIAQRSVE